MVRGAYQGTDTSSSPIFPNHQAYQLPYKPAASRGEQLSAELLHRTGCCHPARGQRETHAGPLQDAHHRYQWPEWQRGGAVRRGRSIQTRRGGQWLLWQTPLWGDWTPEWNVLNRSVNVAVHNMQFNAPGPKCTRFVNQCLFYDGLLVHIFTIVYVVLTSIDTCWCLSHI